MQDILEDIFLELKKAAWEVRHPYRYFCLSSVEDNRPKQRMVVFRGILENVISIYTDIRTPKVVHFKRNPNASVLLYDSEKMKQIVLLGKVEIVEEYNALVWDSIGPKAKKDYTTLLAPGTVIGSSKDVLYDMEKVNFCILKFTFNTIEYLEITRPNHIRIKFNLIGNNWEGRYLVP